MRSLASFIPFGNKRSARSDGGAAASSSDVVRRPRRRWSIATVLMGGFGGLVALAVAAVLALGLSSAGRNTFSLLGDNAELVLSNVELRLRQRLETAERAAGYVADLGEKGLFADAAGATQEEALRTVLALAPDVADVAFIAVDGGGVRVTRRNGSGAVGRVEDLRDLPAGVVADLLSQAESRNVPVWGAAFWSNELRTSMVGVVKAVRRDGRVIGYAGVGVSLGDLSRFLMQLYADLGVNAFVLYDRDHVLAHPALAARGLDLSGRGDGVPLPRIDEVDDPALAGLWRPESAIGGGLGRGIEERRVAAAGERYYVLMRPVAGAGPQNWRIGVWFPEREADREIRRLIVAGVVGLCILLASVAVAFYVGRRISRSIERFAEAASRIGLLDFADVRPMPSSRLVEIDRAAAAFNAMLAGLRWFETYVPKSLTLRLMKRGLAGRELQSVEREVTIMFTDIRGFSKMAQSLAPADTQALLLRHFSLVAACIEEEGGTVDKFIGDSVMAFWGAPDDQPDHAARALRAAAAVAAAIQSENRVAAAEDRTPVRVGVALHAGRVVVGNIGSSSRVNYTIIGDAVNVAARLEELARSLHKPGEDACVLASDDVVALAGKAARTVPLEYMGLQSLRDRPSPTPVWRLSL